MLLLKDVLILLKLQFGLILTSNGRNLLALLFPKLVNLPAVLLRNAMMHQVALTFLLPMELGFVIIVFLLNLALGKMMPVVLPALLLKDIKPVDRLVVLVTAMDSQRVLLVALMTLLATHAKRPAPVNARKIQRVRMYVLVL